MRIKLVCLLSVVLLALPCVAQNGNTPTFTLTQVPDGPSPCIGENRASGVNQRGDIAGRCKDGSGNPRSWLLPKGATTPILIDFSTAPFNPVGGSTTRAIDGRGDLVGRYFDAAGVSHGYLLSNGVFTAIDANLPGAVDTDARGVNNPGTVVGFYDVLTNLPNAGTIPVSHGFMRDSSGTFTAIDFPGATATTALGISDGGDIVGSYVVIVDASMKPPTVAVHGYVLSKGVFTTVDVPFAGATGSQAFGINEQGEIAGAFTTTPVTLATLLKEDPVLAHGYLRSADGSTFTQIDFPNAVSTVCRGGINDHGNIVGLFLDSSAAEHGFVTSR